MHQHHQNFLRNYEMPKVMKVKQFDSKQKSLEHQNLISNGSFSSLFPHFVFINSSFPIRYKGTKELSDGVKYNITREGDKCILVINNLTPDDLDEYSVKARNKGGSRMCRCNVNVRCKLKLIIYDYHWVRVISF